MREETAALLLRGIEQVGRRLRSGAVDPQTAAAMLRCVDLAIRLEVAALRAVAEQRRPRPAATPNRKPGRRPGRPKRAADAAD